MERCRPDELRALFLFEKLTEAQLDWLCERGRVEVMPAGPVYAEGDPASSFYVLLDGSVVLSRRVGEDDIDVSATSQPGVYAGAWRSYLGDQVPQVYDQSMRVTVPSRFFVLDSVVFAELMRDWFPMAVHLIDGGFLYRKNVQELTGQRERLLALGTLSASLTHELNNPAAAAVRASASLRDRISAMRRGLGAMAGYAWDRTTLETLIRLQDETAERVSKAPHLSPLEASDLEDPVAGWLDRHRISDLDRHRISDLDQHGIGDLDQDGISDGWQTAPTFAAGGLDVAWLEHVAATVDAATLDAALKWLNCTVETELLMSEIDDATTRISALVSAAKQYSQLDRAPFQVVDVHELLDSTLLMLGGTIAPGVRVVKDYDRSLPPIPAYPAELNQAWTNLIGNAVSAIGDDGVLTVRTGRDRDQVVVDICDTGPGVAPAIRERIFEPLFTTKPAGQGTGLGLDITWRVVVNKHHGVITVESAPGDTRFRVRLPVTPADTAWSAQPGT